MSAGNVDSFTGPSRQGQSILKTNTAADLIATASATATFAPLTPSHGSSLGGGAIAGIVVGVLLGLVFIIGFVVLILTFIRRHAPAPARVEGEHDDGGMAEAAKVAPLGGVGGTQEIDGRQVKLTDRAPAYPGLEQQATMAAPLPM